MTTSKRDKEKLKLCEDEILRINAELEERVNERTRQLTEANKALLEEIRQRAAAQEEITWLNEDLQRRSLALELANRELEAFSHSVSHDLRAPLRHIEGFSRLLLEEYTDRLDQHAMDYLNRISRSSERMSALIEDLLKLSKVSRSEINQQMVNLTRLAREIISELQDANPERKVTFKVDDDMTVWGDSHLLRVMLTNLLENAWKYTSTSDNVLIEFGCGEKDGEKVWFVRDNGVGFDMTYADRLFGTFKRLHSAREFEGTGIGLATVQRIINRHEGRIWGEGVIGLGATFYFTLPEREWKEPPTDWLLPASP